VGEDWHTLAADVLQARIATYEGSEIRFNLLAVVQDRLVQLRQRLAALQSGLCPTFNVFSRYL
jgi:hypothetical protein